MVFYLSGKVSDIEPQFYEKKFQDAEDVIMGLGHICYNPVKEFLERGYNDLSRERAMQMLVGDMLHECDAIFMLRDWQESAGAIQEYEVARLMGLKVFFQSDGELKFRD